MHPGGTALKTKPTIDPIMAEMHAIKDANAKRFGGNFRAFFPICARLSPETLKLP
jgi:hypothetical protein